jgi:hypothetical protein
MKVTTHAPVTGYDPDARFYATRYKQGGRTVYSLDLSLAQIASIIPAPDPTVVQPGNRIIRVAHAASFGDYIRNTEDFVVPAIVLRGSSVFDFEVVEKIEGAEFGIVSLPRLAVSELHILDGQHRILGIHMAVKAIADDLDKARSALALARKAEDENVQGMFKDRIGKFTAQRKRFETERMTIQIYVEDEMGAFQQMFYDIADNALGITASVRARFDTRKIVNRVLQDVLLHPLLMDRVDLENDRLGRSNENLLTAKHVADLVRILAVGLEGRISKRLESELHENDLVVAANEFFDTLVKAFPKLRAVQEGLISPIGVRADSQLGSPVTLRVLAGVWYELLDRGVSMQDVESFFHALNEYLEVPATEKFVAEVGHEILTPGATGPSARRQDAKAYRDLLVDWAQRVLE